LVSPADISQHFHAKVVSIYDIEQINTGFDITEYYAYHREAYQKPMIWRAACYWLLAFYQGFVSFAIPAFAYAVTQNSDGRMDDLYSGAFVSLFVIIITEHVVTYQRVRSWNRGVLACLAVTLICNIGDIFFVEYKAGQEIDRHQFYIMSELKFWLILLISVIVGALPFFLQKYWKMLVQKPAYFTK
jgi:magnesium-transporting ATPase (P-type)